MMVPAPIQRSVAVRRQAGRLHFFCGGLVSIGLLASGCGTTPVVSQEKPGGGSVVAAGATNGLVKSVVGPLTFERAVAMATERSEDISVLRALSRIAELRIRTARDWRDPELRTSYSEDSSDSQRSRWSYGPAPANASLPAELQGNPPPGTFPAGSSHDTGSDSGDAYSVALRFFPPNPWARRALVSQETAAYRASVEDLRAAEWSVAAEVRGLFLELAYLDKDLAEIRALVTLRRELCDTLQKHADQGMATFDDTADASRRYLSMLTDLASAEQRRDQTRGQLAFLTGVPADTLVAETAALPASDTTYIKTHIDKLEREALANSAEIAASAWRVEVARAMYRGARSQRIPWINHIQTSYSASSDSGRTQSYGGDGILAGQTRAEYDYTSDSSDGEEWTVSAAISLPVFSWMSKMPELRQAEVRLNEAVHTATIQKMKTTARNALEVAMTLEASRRAHGERTRDVTRELEALLTKGDGPNAPLEPQRALRIREQLTESRRLALEFDYNCSRALTTLEEALGLGFAIRPTK